ncbi:hypothetical protein B0H63DRAFT_447448 [Podospora didyma]|uniref:Uncharacterized protein n=1 Tax=Podospora didyma TaxID=330526 RepID=A0AAE0NRQ2_9PEZI|nr:hypothetical protein B0H63DRAFT_447448 [Podospora didyma]
MTMIRRSGTTPENTLILKTCATHINGMLPLQREGRERVCDKYGEDADQGHDDRIERDVDEDLKEELEEENDKSMKSENHVASQIEMIRRHMHGEDEGDQREEADESDMDIESEENQEEEADESGVDIISEDDWMSYFK